MQVISLLHLQFASNQEKRWTHTRPKELAFLCLLDMRTVQDILIILIISDVILRRPFCCYYYCYHYYYFGSERRPSCNLGRSGWVLAQPKPDSNCMRIDPNQNPTQVKLEPTQLNLVQIDSVPGCYSG